MKRTLLNLRVNGCTHEVAARPYDVLLDTLREDLLLTGTRRGCDMGTCGCCAVLVEGRARLSCLTLTAEVQGREITTVEGLRRPDGGLHPVQRAFHEAGGSQCGFCTPGFIMAAVSLLERNPDPGDEEIRSGLSGNLCRCTGYVKIFEAVRRAAAWMRQEGGTPA
jgi:carbon-monoxide dehydrogenase small subunit